MSDMGELFWKWGEDAKDEPDHDTEEDTNAEMHEEERICPECGAEMEATIVNREDGSGWEDAVCCPNCGYEWVPCPKCETPMRWERYITELDAISGVLDDPNFGGRERYVCQNPDCGHEEKVR